MHISIFALGWRSLLRDLRTGGLRLMFAAVALAVAALSSVAFFADRLNAGLVRDAAQLLGGDVVVASDQPLPQAFAQQAQDWGLASSQTLDFPTMARAEEAQGGASRLVALKSVAPGYPLRGQLRSASTPGAPDEVSSPDIPAPGQVWIDAALLDALGLRMGDTLLLGDARLQVARILTQEPDRGAGFMSFAPRVLMNAADLPATGLVQPASRITYRFAVAGDTHASARFARWAEQYVASADVRGLRVETLESGSPQMRQTLERAQKFLHLVALLAALLCAVAVALAARNFANAHLDGAALLRVLGLGQRHIAGAYVVEFALVGLAASALGLALGWGLHHAFAALLADLVRTQLPAPGLWPVGLGLGLGMTLLFAFGLPPVLQLAQVPPLRVLRRELGALRPASAAVLGLGVAGFAALLLAVSSDLKLGLIAVGGFGAAVLLFAALAWLALRLLARLVPPQAPRWLVLAARQLTSRPIYAVVQISSLAVGLLALVLLVLLRTDLIASWRAATPPHAPNRFVINILPDQAPAFEAHLRAAGVQRYDWYPMFRGRLVAINDRPVSAQDYTDERAQRLVEREFNLSHTAQAPEHNPVVAGRWQAEEAQAVSVEQGLAETLGLQLGDRLRFDIAGMTSEARITSLRQVDWSSMRANFFVIYPQADLQAQLPGLPVTYLAAYRAPDTPDFDNALVRQFPNVTNVDLSQTLAQVQRVLEQVSRAVELLFGFTVAAGLVVLFAAVAATREARAREWAILRALGAPSQLLRQVQRAELAGLGLLAGALASSVAVVLAWALARWVFDFAWKVPLLVPLGGALAGAVLALMAGWWSLRGVLQRPVVQTLRQSSSE